MTLAYTRACCAIPALCGAGGRRGAGTHEQLGELFGCGRTAQVEPLRAIAAILDEQIEGALLRDPLGDDRQTEVVGELDRGAHDDRVVVDRGEVRDNDSSTLISSTGSRCR